MDPTVILALLAGLAVTLYVLLDGFDLGVGILLPVARDETERDRMVDSVAPVWDGNETWLIFGGVLLLAGFPAAYALVLPALYVPLFMMLLSLGLRGVSFEFRFQTERWRRFWDMAFAGGSITAVLCQGLVLGTLLQGLAVRDGRYDGGAFDFLSPFSLLVAVALLGGYTTLGASWLVWRTEGALNQLARVTLKVMLILFLALAIVTVASSVQIQPRVAAVWATHPTLLAVDAGGILLMFAACWRSLWGARDWPPFACVVGIFALHVLGLALAVWPWVVPFNLTIWDAVSPTASRLFILVGAAILIPIILAYTGFAYWTFRGKTRALEPEEPSKDAIGAPSSVAAAPTGAGA